MKSIVKVIALSTILVGLLAACGSHSTTKLAPTSTPITRKNLKFVVIGEGLNTDPFWSVVYHGAVQAAQDMGVGLSYQGLTAYNTAQYSNLIDNVVATQPDGIMLSIADCTALSPSIQRAQLANIPIISIHSGADCATKLGLLNHVGLSNYDAGVSSGQNLIALGAKHVLCINPDVGFVDYDNRCKGIQDAFKQNGKQSEVFGINLSDMNAAQQNIQNQILHDPTVDAVIMADNTVLNTVSAAIQQLGDSGKIALATFDISPAVLQDIQQGSVNFAVDQQAYLQGYLPVVFMTLYKTNANTVSNPIVLTGPSFVTKSNVDQVLQFESAGTH